MKRLYDSKRWRRESKSFLSNPDNCLCVYCLQRGIEKPAVIVDHIKPHKGEYNLFWDQNNWQGVCVSCHSGIKRKIEHNKIIAACDSDGFPIDPNHHWNK